MPHENLSIVGALVIACGLVAYIGLMTYFGP